MNRIFLKVRPLALLLAAICSCLALWSTLLGRSGIIIDPCRSSTWQRLNSSDQAISSPGSKRSVPAAPAVSFPLLDDPAVLEAAVAFDRQQPVVRIIHQSWMNASLPPLFARWSRSFPKHFPTFRYALWTDADNRRLIARHYPWFLPRFDSYGVGVQKADVSRLFYMYHFGGLYCDMDCECLANFEHLLVNASLAFGAMEGKMIFSESDPSYVAEGQIENSFMYSRPRHPFFWDLILQLNSTKVGVPIMTSGPYLLMRGIHSARRHGLDKTQIDGRPYLTVYPPKLFNPYSWIQHNSPQCRLYGEFTEETLRTCRDSFRHSYVLQYHTQVWDKGRTNVLQRIRL